MMFASWVWKWQRENKAKVVIAKTALQFFPSHGGLFSWAGPCLWGERKEAEALVLLPFRILKPGSNLP